MYAAPPPAPERHDDPMAAWLAEAAPAGPAGDAYRRCLGEALAAAPDWQAAWAPLIAAQFARPAILAAEFYRHSATEGIGASTIALVAGQCADPALAAAMAAHARDEERHCRMFDALARHLAPAEPNRFADLHADNDAFLASFGGDVDWFLCDTHIAELRNLVLLGLYVRAAEAADAEPYVRRSLERIFDDEWRHVAYTAPLVAAVIARGEADRTEFAATVTAYADAAMADAARIRHDLEEPRHA
ncbi:hypothetical protein [Sphingomonas rubra]|uniref:Ferritin-like domain-containing protein n=1 Tax=Sphingomonas rubra TaxID=634430 RepID=A0A1I5SGF1_9SPHN|nr:hypothetical protein [Sphingomonas rubra]SFP69789.1 hypothetical protein SAMN04488241_105214 [Sphingomonas rubra]